MNPGRYIMPNMAFNSTMRMAPIANGNFFNYGAANMLGKVINSIKSFNWSGLLNGASKTLNVVNQTIPLVRQAGPMFSNIKSMSKLAKAFKAETKHVGVRPQNIFNDTYKENGNNKGINTINNNSVLNQNNQCPTFFI